MNTNQSLSGLTTDAQVSSHSRHAKLCSPNTHPKGITSPESIKGWSSSSHPKPYCKNTILSDPHTGQILLSRSLGSKNFIKYSSFCLFILLYNTNHPQERYFRIYDNVFFSDLRKSQKWIYPFSPDQSNFYYRNEDMFPPMLYLHVLLLHRQN